MRFLIAALVMSLAGCAASPPRVLHLVADFSEAQAQAQLEPGANTIVGNALMRQNGGGVVTCAGVPVHLIPATDYAANRIAMMYGGAKFMRAPYPEYQFEPDPPGYKRAIRTATCNAQGFFTFDHVKDGTYYVQTAVVWKVGNAIQGGSLVDRVTVFGGKVVEVTITP